MHFFIVIVFGLLIGSFLNVCIYRVPRKQSIVFLASHCTKCKTELKPLDLVPVFSYCFLKGKCKYCKMKIGSKYAIIELVNAVMYLFLFMKFGFSIEFLEFAILTSLLIVITSVDLESQIIPDEFIVFGFAVIIIFIVISVFRGNLELLNSGIGLLLGGGIFLLIAVLSNGAMGGGDIKLMALLGFWFGWQSILLIMFLSFVLGAIISVTLLLFKIKSRKDKIPFAPFIVLATILALFFGNEIISFYINTIVI